MRGDPARILLVDDQPANLFALEQVLAAPGYELVRAESGAGALALLLRGDCAVILLDVSMPDMDGYEVARLLRQSQRTRDIPIVFLTARAIDEVDVLGGYESGAIDYLVKPVRPEVLRSKVARFVALHRAREEVRRQAERLRAAERNQHRHAFATLELRALQRQQAAQLRYQTLVEGLSRAIAWILDPATLAPRLVSPGAREILGIDAAWWSTAPRIFPDLVPDEDRARFLEALRTLSPGGAPARVEHRMFGAGGRVRWFDTSVRLIAGEDPSSRELHGLSTDVTATVEARDEAAFLARASALLGGSLDVESTLRTAARLGVPDLADWSIVETGAPGLSGHELVSAHPFASREEEAREAAAQLDVARVRDQQRTALAEPAAVLHPRAGSGSSGPIAARRALVIPLFAHGERMGTLCLFAREAERLAARLSLAEELGRRIAQALENASLHEQTRLAVLAREEFLSIASHELRTPLSALSIQARLLEQLVVRREDGPTPGDTEELRRRVASIQRQVARLGALTNSVLDLARIRSARLQLDLEPCDLAEVVHDVAARFDDALRTEGRALRLAAPEPIPGRWDRTRIEQMLSNLVGNAVKHAGSGDVAVAARKEGASAILVVSDTGPGIPAADQERVFDAFAQGRRTTAGGLGLGLYIARSIASAHGGTIALASEPGRGTTFRVELPLEAAAETDAPPQGPLEGAQVIH